MPTEVKQGQLWSAWASGRQQWLLAAVTIQKNGSVTLKYDSSYGIKCDDEQVTDENTMLTNRNLFRFVSE